MFGRLLHQLQNLISHYSSGKKGLDNIHDSINWDRSCVGGSFALHQITKDPKWQPNDLDVFIGTETNDEFDKEYERFKTCSGCTEIKSYDKYMYSNLKEVLGRVKTLKCPNFDKNVQIIEVFDLKNENLENRIDAITDNPTCVTYRIKGNGKKDFRINEKGGELLMGNGYLNIKNTPDHDRRKKWKKRGYNFL